MIFQLLYHFSVRSTSLMQLVDKLPSGCGVNAWAIPAYW